MIEPADAYRHCEEIARREAANFYYGMRLLPRPKRAALSAVYSLARRIDDVADGDLPQDVQLCRLRRLRRDLAGPPKEDDPVLIAVFDAAGRFPIPLAAFGEVIDGAEMDVHGTRYRTFDELVPYCRRVAGAIGRLSLGVFGPNGDESWRLADDLGVAFQLTNILRDVREDLARGRLYLPEEDLERFGCRAHDGELQGPVAEVVRFEAARAQEWFDRGLGLLPLLDRPCGRCVAAMAGIYRRLLERIERDPEAVLNGRVSLSGWRKSWVAVRSLAGAA